MNAPGSTLDQICIAFSSSLQSRKATKSVADRSRGSFLMKALLLYTIAIRRWGSCSAGGYMVDLKRNTTVLITV